MKHLLANLVLTALLLSIISISSFAQNIALNRPVVVSSVQSTTSFTGNLAVDGNSTTRWSSAPSDPQWIYVDLGSQYNITTVNITWEAAYGKDYRIDVSNDASTWTTIKTITGNTSLTNTNSVTGTGRYVRIYGTLRGTTFGYSIYELVVNGSVVTTTQSGTNLALNRPVTVSSVQSSTSYTGNLAIDGNSTTRWSSAPSDPQWIYVDLGSQYNITAVNITWETAYGKNYTIAVSNDASTWTTIKTITSNTSLTNNNSVTGTGRYVRIYGTLRGTTFGYSIFELVVNGSLVTTTQSGTNLALNRPVTVSSVQSSTSYTGNLAVDGNSTTRWSSAPSDPQWIYVDLGSQYNITTVNITWEAAYGKDYRIDVSNDASTWTTIKSITGNTSLTNTNSVTGTGRYVRIYGTLRGTTFGYSIYELVVNGSAVTTTQSGTNLALNRPATVSSVQSSTSYTGNLAVDGNSTTRWSSAPSDPQWIYVDLGSQYNITTVNITWEAAYGKDYRIDVSNDASTWTTIKSITGNTSLTNTNSVTGTGRYVRIYGTQRGTTYGYSIWELQVYGSATTTTTTTPPPPGPTGGSGSGTLPTSGKTYYFSTTDGDDSRTSTQAQSSSTPWKTLSKLNSFFSSLQPGDQVAFKRGDTFYGTITANKSGTSSAPILIAAYGTGLNPIITGFTTVSSWTSVGSGRYQATVSGGLSTLNMVTRNGAFQAMGKMPKGNTGYYTIGSAGTNSVTSSGISGLPSFAGGEICWRAHHWVLWRGTVNSQSSTTVGFTPFASTSGGSVENPLVNYGFFFQNSPNACTQLGEWAYAGSSHVITMYFGSDNPSSHSVKAATIDNLINGSNLNYLSFNNITFQGANSNIFNLSNCGHITINSCYVYFAGLYGIFGNGTAANWSITNNSILYSNSIAIHASSSSSAWTISGNTISNTGSVSGMGGSGEGQYFGIKGVRNGSTVSSNSITNTGYTALMFSGTNNTISNNYIDYFGFVKDDAAAIYCGVDNLLGSKIIGNIITRGMGCPPGTPDKDMRTLGIYIDDGASNLEVSGNTVAFCGRSGIFCHNSHDLNIHNNTLFDNTVSSISYYNDGVTVSNITYMNNINFCKTSSQLVYESSGASTSISYFTNLDYNYYCRPISESNSFRASLPNWTFWSLASWKTFIGKDAHSNATPKTITDTSQLKFYYNNTSAAKTFSFSGTYIDVYNKSYAGSITLQPYTSAVLLYSSGTTTQAVSNTAEVVDPNALNTMRPAFVLYPNPVTDNFTLELNNSQTGKMNVQIVNVSGQTMRSLMLNKDLPSAQFSLPASDLPKGVYFVQVRIGNWSDIKRMVKL